MRVVINDLESVDLLFNIGTLQPLKRWSKQNRESKYNTENDATSFLSEFTEFVFG